jgi:hypothetical protein
MQNTFLSPVEHIVCLPDSSSGSGEGNERRLKSLRSNSGEESGASMPKVDFLSAGGGESMGESDFSLGIFILAAASC